MFFIVSDFLYDTETKKACVIFKLCVVFSHARIAFPKNSEVKHRIYFVRLYQIYLPNSSNFRKNTTILFQNGVDSKPRMAGSASTLVVHNQFSAGLEYQIGLLKFFVFVQNIIIIFQN